MCHRKTYHLTTLEFKSIFRPLSALIPALLFILQVTSCKKEGEFQSFAGFTQGTTYSIVYRESRLSSADKVKEEVEALLAEFDMSLSLYKDSSLISRINRNETTETDNYISELLNLSALISQRTGGAFDITVGALVRAWGFGPDERREVSDEKVDSIRQFTGFEKISLNNGRIVKSDPRTSLDFNAIAQGYAVDVVCAYFDRSGSSDYLVEIGGEVRVKGTRGDRMWKIGIDRPRDNNMVPGSDLEAIISIEDRALATSGNYRKFYVEDGVKYSHTIDPRTGYPARSRLLSATILAKNCATADAVATACMVMGVEKSIEFINTNPDIEGFLIFSGDGGEFMTWTSEKLAPFVSEQ